MTTSTSDDVLKRVFVSGHNRHSGLKEMIRFGRSRSESSTHGRAASIDVNRESSKLSIQHPTVLNAMSRPGRVFSDTPHRWATHMEPAQTKNWGDYFDLYEDPSIRELSDDDMSVCSSEDEAYEYDASSYEPDMLMEDIPVNLPNYKPSFFKKVFALGHKKPGLIVTEPEERTIATKTTPATSNKLTRWAPKPRPKTEDAVVKTQDTIIEENNASQIDPIELFRSVVRKTVILRPLDALHGAFPEASTVILILEVLAVMWILFQVSILIDTISIVLRSVCMPLIILGRILGY